MIAIATSSGRRSPRRGRTLDREGLKPPNDDDGTRTYTYRRTHVHTHTYTYPRTHLHTHTHAHTMGTARYGAAIRHAAAWERGALRADRRGARDLLPCRRLVVVVVVVGEYSTRVLLSPARITAHPPVRRVCDDAAPPPRTGILSSYTSSSPSRHAPARVR